MLSLASTNRLLAGRARYLGCSTNGVRIPRPNTFVYLLRIVEPYLALENCP